MNDIKRAIETLRDISRSKKGSNIEEHVPTLTLTIELLESPSPSIDQYKSLSGYLREHLQPLYLTHLQPTLDYAIAILRFLHNEKIVPFLRSGDPGRANLWVSSASSLISGILDFLEQHQTKKARETVGFAVYPTICAFYFANGQGLLSLYDGNILSNVYMLLGETVESPGGDVSNLRDHHIGGRRLGRTIAEIRNYLALESIVNLLGNLIPPLKAGKEKRNRFLQEVFEEFKDCNRILQALETIKRDWTVTATKIIYFLAESDIRFPQPFQVIRFQVERSLMTTSEPIFVDNKSFVASLDQGGSVDSLMIPFSTVSTITISALNGSEMKVELLINKAPLLGNNPMSLPQQGTYLVSFSIMRAALNNFGKVMRERNLKMERPASTKLSQAPSELLPEIDNDTKWQTKATMLTNMAKHGDPDPIDRNKFATSSPGPANSMASNVDDHQVVNGVVGELSDNLPSTVFLDPNGNFSIHPPRATDLDHGQTETAPKKVLSRKQQPNSDDEEICFQPKRNTIILSDDEDERPPRAPKKKTMKSDAAQLPKVLETDDTTSRQAQKPKTEIVDEDSRKPKSGTVNDTKKSGVSKKRALVDDTSDVEAPAAKRVRQESDNVPPSPVKQAPKKYGRKSQNVKIASPAKDKDSRFAADFDEIPKPKQPQMKAMKGKDGKVAPKPRPVPTKKNKKQGEGKEAAQPKVDVELQDADKTLVEQNEVNVERSAKVLKPQAVSKNESVNTRSKKSNMAPWEAQDFASVKVEMTKEVSVNFDPIDDLPPKTGELPSDIVDDTENDDVSLPHVGMLGDRYVDFLEPLKADSTTSSEPPPPSPPAPDQSGRIWIDLTNSPKLVERIKPTSLKRAVGKTRRHESVEEDEVSSVHEDQTFRTTKTGKAHRKVEKLPLPPTPSDRPESVCSTPRRAKHSRGTNVRKLSSPIRLRQVPLGSGKHKPTQKTRHLEEEKTQSRAIPKEQKGGSSGSSRRQVRGSEVEDDPDLKIASILGEINKVLVGNIQNRFTGMSSELQRTKRELKAEAAEELGKINYETYKRYNNLVDLYEGYAFRKANFVDALEVFEKATADSARSYRDILNDFRRNNLRNRLPKEIVKESTIADILKLTKLNIEI